MVKISTTKLRRLRKRLEKNKKRHYYMMHKKPPPIFFQAIPLIEERMRVLEYKIKKIEPRPYMEGNNV